MSPNPFGEMLVAVLPRLRSYAMAMTRNRAAADDLTQEAAFRALKAKDQFQPGTNFNAWMYRILRNEYISSIRKDKRSQLTSMENLPENVFSKPGDQENNLLSREVIRAMDQLNQAQREVLVLICAGGASYEEAAETLGCTVGTIKSRMFRARRHMQSLIMGDDLADMTSDSAAAEGSLESCEDAPMMVATKAMEKQAVVGSEERLTLQAT